ncbi:restriction endonuclease subunit S [Myroides odoratimimus]|uniref:restriction endonuclease subunit S n=1 Tax=Myroides odoratimimus TaxID=76832 RepID=UPI00370AD985
MSNWKTYKLSDFAEVNPRISLKQGNEYSFVEMKDLDATFKYVTPSAKKELKGGAKFENGDTLFARITPCLENGKICQVKELENNIGFGSTEFLIFRGKENISDTDFVYYLMRSDYVRNNAIQMMSGTSGRQRVERSALEELEIQAPDLATQNQIAQILSSLDDKIEVLQQMNQTLEKIAQAIFKEWFVDFNFPGFDGELVDGLPKGWSYKTIKELGKVVTGNTPSSKNPEYFGDIIPFVTPTDFKNFGKLIIGANRYLSVEGSKVMKTRLLPRHSIIVTCIGSDMGKVAINSIECLTNQQINSIIANDNSFVDYLYYDLVYKYNYLRNIATGGSTMPIINKSRFEEIEVLMPKSDVLENFQAVMDSFNSKIEENIRQTQSLTQTRDTLLPKLMSGEFEVKN